MGLANSTKQQLSDVSTVKMTNCKGRGSFATCLIKRGTVLVETTGSAGESKSHPINDADFDYPHLTQDDKDEEVFKKLYHTFQRYQSQETDLHGKFKVPTEPTSTKNNLHHKADRMYVVLRDIQPGEELTHRYGCCKWFIYVATDLININPISLFYGRKYDTGRVLPILLKVAQELGYNLDIKQPIWLEERSLPDPV